VAYNTITTATGAISPEMRTFYARNLLSRLLPQLVYALYATEVEPMPQKEGQTVQFRRFNSLPTATTPLTEGVTPNGNALSMSTVTATPLQYGDFVAVSDVLELTAPDPMLTRAGEVQGEQVGESYDETVRDVITAGTNVQYANGRVSRVTVAATDVLNATEVKKAVRTMLTNKVRKLNAMVNPSDGVGTLPINSTYVGICGPQTHYDLKADAKWKSVEQYASQTALLPFEVGALDDVRFVMTQKSKVFSAAGAAGADVHATLIIGQNAYGIVAPEGVQSIIKGFGEGDDPLNQRATSGWKGFWTTVILNQVALLRIEHGVSA
jgi:N4-gp56 family major capsid protein